MITQETAAEIWHAYREIETGHKLLEDTKDALAKAFDKTAPLIKDAQGRPRHLELGIPSSENSRRLFNVPVQIAESIIRLHIAEKQKELVLAMEKARIELGTLPAPATQGLTIPPHLQEQVQRWISAAEKLLPPEIARPGVHTSDGIPFRAITYAKHSPGIGTITVASWELLSPNEEPLGIFFFENPVPEN